ncbi:putative membrane protein YesL [Actinoplanes tereljensis]|uniref:Ferredoxin-NADPH reductase n=1 Tax=Paractinoplanes tereljensis TaxID=571912 RepID=A0A919NXN5_9ACTN|nr:hypothetical protein [Actinoplanes tereljensis]GIF25577.1 hypothetical protein Ate02nite_83070 [Actinoplanes tereljensis]
MIKRFFDLAYLGLMTNLLLALSCAPLVVLLMTTDPGRSWPLLALLTPLAGPGVCGAFAVLAAYSADRDIDVARTFTRVWRASARRSLALVAAATATVVVLGADIRFVWGRPVGALVIPLLAVAIVLVLATTVLALVVLSERPTVRLRDAARVSLFLAVRHWYLTLFSLVVLGLFEVLLSTRPAIALGLAAAPLLYLVWSGSRFSLTAVLPVTRGVV